MTTASVIRRRHSEDRKLMTMRMAGMAVQGREVCRELSDIRLLAGIRCNVEEEKRGAVEAEVRTSDEDMQRALP
ncbi:hypothetical protein [Burkholderia savannae]|uniref:hypothetical protein n=1 Tax=Burkholderia savannae TaxID=1637837 RepID=UPI0012E3C70C|nr:hypothetical protein [Burkholderia savannae]